MNDYFDHPNSATRFIRNTLARADDINARLDEVSEGFDEVEADLALKAPLASPTFTGTVTASGATSVLVPTPASLADDSTKAATTAWVNDVIGANTTLLPTQTGNANKVLKTDGTVASWDTPYPRYSIFSAAAAAATPVSSGEDLTYGRLFITGLATGTPAVAYSNSLFIADTGVVTDKIATSPDGEVWTLRTMPSSVRWRVATDGTNSLATAWNSTAVAISTNGTTWTSATALGGALGASLPARPAVVGTTWIAGSNGTTTYTSTNHGTSWSVQTLPAAPSAVGAFYVINGRFWYHNTGTTAYYSTTGATGSWTSSTLPVTPVLSWLNPDGTVSFAESAAGSQVYECTGHDTYAAVPGVTLAVTNTPVLKVGGVWASISLTEARSWHASGEVLRTASAAASGSIAAAAGGVSVLPSANAANGVLTYTATSWPTGLFEI